MNPAASCRREGSRSRPGVPSARTLRFRSGIMSDLVASERAMAAPVEASVAAPPARGEAVLSLLREDVEAAGKATRSVRLGANVATLGLLFAGAPAMINHV